MPISCISSFQSNEQTPLIIYRVIKNHLSLIPYVSSREIRMVEELPAGKTAIRIEHHHLPEEVKLDLIHQFQRLLPIALLVRTLQLLQAARNKVVLDSALLDSHDVHDLLQLIEFALAFEQGLAGDYKMENAAQCPHIHLSAVSLCPQQQLGSSIVQRPHHIRHRLLRKIQLLRHAQVDDLQVVVVGIDVRWFWLRLRMRILGDKHDVGRFQVAVDDVQGVKFQCPLDRLAEQLLNGELFLILDDPIQVCTEPLHDHHGLLLVHEGLNHPRHVSSSQDLVEITLADEAGRQADLTQCLEAFHSHRLLGRIVSRAVDHPVGSLLHPLHDGVAVPEGRSLHQLSCDYQLSIRLQSPTLLYPPKQVHCPKDPHPK